MSLGSLPDRALALDELVDVAIALASPADLPAFLGRVLEAGRRATGARAGTLYLLEDRHLRVAARHDDDPRRRPSEVVSLDESGLPARVALTGAAMSWDGARSLLAVPLPDPSGAVLGVLELLDLGDDSGPGAPVDAETERLVQALAAQAAVAIQTSRLGEATFKDPLTDLYNRRYFGLRVEEEVRRHLRFGHPLALVVIDVDGLATLNDTEGRAGGDEILRAVARLLLKHSRSFTVLARLDGDDFAAILANTPKAGAFAYAERIRALVERHPLAPTPVTASFGVAGLPADADAGPALMAAADRALAKAKRLGGNRVGTC